MNKFKYFVFFGLLVSCLDLHGKKELGELDLQSEQQYTITVPLFLGNVEVIVEVGQLNLKKYSESARLALTLYDETYILYEDGGLRQWGDSSSIRSVYYKEAVQAAILILHFHKQYINRIKAN